MAGRDDHDPPLLVHVGFHKTGSTWLQQGLFIDRAAGFVTPWTREQVAHTFILVQPFRFNARQARESLERASRDGRGRGLLPVLTHERLSGSPHGGSYDAEEIANRLVTTFPDSRVLMVIREQRGMILSCYKQYVKIGGPLSLRRYVTRPRSEQGSIPLFCFEQFDYDLFVDRYQELFGADRVLVLPYEQLVNDPASFAAAIVGFVGTVPSPQLSTFWQNPSLSACTTSLKRRANTLLVRHPTNPTAPIDRPGLNRHLTERLARLDRHVPAAVAARWEGRMREFLDEAVADRYADSNRRTAELTGLDLGRYGYTA